jgi:hypothetical protein
LFCLNHKKILLNTLGVWLIKFSKKGFVFTLEACISFLIFCFVCINLASTQNFSFSELIVLQQENDLLKVWSINYPSDQDAINDCKLLLGEFFELKIGERIVYSKKKSENSVASSAVLLNENLYEVHFEITAYYD